MKNQIVKLLAVGFLLGAAPTRTEAQIVDGFDDIQLWVGSGANESVLVIDFHDGESRQSFAWGYRWNGSATAFDMLSAIDSAWQNLTITTPGFAATISYQEGLVTHSREIGSFAVFPTDYLSWGYYLAGGSATVFDNNPPYGPVGTLNPPGGGTALPSSWTLSPAGSADRQLAHGSWDALSFGQVGDDFLHQTPPSNTVYAAVPEPSTWLLAVLALTTLAYAKKRVHLG